MLDGESSKGERVDRKLPRITDVVAYVLAVLTALSNAFSNVLQRRENMDEPLEVSFSLRMIWDLAYHKTWLAGVGAITVSFLLQASALNFGQLAAVPQRFDAAS